MLDERLEVGLLIGQLRTIGGELAADGVEERAQLAELVAGRQVERDAELAAPRRVRPLRITWIGRSMTCESSPATKTAMISAMRRGQQRGPSESFSALRISSVDTPTRIEPKLSSPTTISWRASSVRPSPE